MKPASAPRLLPGILCATSLFAFLCHPLPAQEAVLELDEIYGEVDGRTLLLDVGLPPGHEPGAPPLPGVILIHGGGWAMGSKDDFRWLTRKLPLEGQGYVVFAVNYRLTSDGRSRWPDQLDDVQRAVRWVRSQAERYGVDPERIGAVGGSAGGMLATFLGLVETQEPDDPELAPHSSRVQAVATLAGPVDLADESFLAEGPGDWVRGLVAKLLEGPEETLEERRHAASPIHEVREGAAPFLILHGELDDIVPVAHGQRLHEALTEVSTPSQLVVFPDEGHAFLKPENQQRVAEELRGFLELHLHGKESASPSRALPSL